MLQCPGGLAISAVNYSEPTSCSVLPKKLHLIKLPPHCEAPCQNVQALKWLMVNCSLCYQRRRMSVVERYGVALQLQESQGPLQSRKKCLQDDFFSVHLMIWKLSSLPRTFIANDQQPLDWSLVGSFHLYPRIPVYPFQHTTSILKPACHTIQLVHDLLSI
ncbi:hypothetical protein O6H91_05G010400 [Diphasiastrum complanatum]|uniref:Uncharacterized protein n=1 Tax=Diphasiastrum complanatum TaxID=34168 RepID=A0ACC2DKX8_DIPCM|nr:hypothetical protein O6H91_05G010400 [Diphasiastrum complanatum]